MALTRSQLIDRVEAGLRDSTNVYYSVAEIGNNLTDTLREIGKYRKHLVRIPYKLETRYGTATSTSSGNLVDATKVQFLSTDTGKRVFNDTDKTWADIISYSSTSQVGLNYDIMASGETYYLYNKGCWASNQVNIEDIDDMLWIESVEYPAGHIRPIDFLANNILQIGYDGAIDDSDPTLTGRETTAWVTFAKRHKLSQMTDFAGAFKGAGSKGDTTVTIDALTNDDVIEVDQEFTIANHSQVYTVVDTQVTVASSEAALTFYPGLENDVADNAVVTFVSSTLDRDLDIIAVEICISRALLDEASLHINTITALSSDAYKNYLQAAAIRRDNAYRWLSQLADPSTDWERLMSRV